MSNRLYRLRLVRRPVRAWTRKEQQYVMDNYLLLGVAACAATLGRTKRAVMSCAKHVGAEAGHRSIRAAERRAAVIDLAGKGWTVKAIAGHVGLHKSRVEQLLAELVRAGLMRKTRDRKRGSGGYFTYTPTLKWRGNYSEDFRGKNK